MPVQDIHLRSVLDSLAGVVLLLRPDGVVIEANRAACARLGVRREELVGQPLGGGRWWRGPPEQGTHLRRALARAADGVEARCRVQIGVGGGGTGLELALRPVLGPDGAVETISAEGHLPAPVEQGAPDLDRALRHEMRERRRAEVRLELQADMLDHIEDAVFAWDRDDRIVALNAAAGARFGLPPGAGIGQRLDDVLRWRPLDPDDDRASIEDAVTRLGRWEGVVVQRLPGRRESVVEVVVRPLDREDVREGRLAVVRDVTVLRETEEALRRSEQRFRRALEVASAVVYEIDAGGRFVTSNHEGVFGAGARDDAGWPIHPDDVERVRREREAAVEAGRPWKIAYRIRHTEGRWIDVEDHGSLTHDRRQRPRRIGIVLDITERRQAERALVESREELASLAASLEERVADRTRQVRALSAALTLAEQRERRRLSQVLHDGLQQLLFSLGMRLQAARKQAKLGDGHPSDEALQHCQDLVRKAVSITRSIALELNPPTLRGSELRTSLLWLAKHVRDVHGLEVAVDVPEDVHVQGPDTRALVVQVVRELLVNAARHAGCPAASLRARRRRDVLEVEVSDPGRGFDLDQARAQRRSSDAFGLFSVEERLRLFGGSMEVQTAPGRGTTVRLRVPLDET